MLVLKNEDDNGTIIHCKSEERMKYCDKGKYSKIAHFVLESVLVVFFLAGCMSLFDVFSAQECRLQISPVQLGLADCRQSSLLL